MPELPEVETVRRGLDARIRGARFASVRVNDVRLRRRIDPERLATLVGRTVRAVGRRAKYLLLDVGDDLVLLVHLGMSGQLLVVPAGSPAAPHEHVRAGIEGVGDLVFRDPRRFGLFHLDRLDAITELRDLGPEPLGEGFDAAAIQARLRATARDVKAALLDQRVVAGVGNIYANEVLFRAGVRPTRRGHRLRHLEAARIVTEIRIVLAEAVEKRGTSFSDYFDVDGSPGSFYDSLWVFDREGRPCRKCGTTIKRRVHGGRSSFYCPSCQT